MTAYRFEPTNAGKIVFKLGSFFFEASSPRVFLLSLAAAFHRRNPELLNLPLFPSPDSPVDAAGQSEPIGFTVAIERSPDHPARDRYTPLTLGTITLSMDKP